ncbi:MAG: hypothetical protein PHY80_06370, partial [Rickettsiales bacterium]|nr:hypothetical protein [Rickettsiales bacterium]
MSNNAELTSLDTDNDSNNNLNYQAKDYQIKNYEAKCETRNYNSDCNFDYNSNILVKDILIDNGYYITENIIQDEKIHRFGYHLNHWYLCFENYIIADDWSEQLNRVDRPINQNKYNSLSPSQKSELRRKIEEAKRFSEIEKQKSWEEISIKANEEWNTLSEDCNNSKYLIKKQVNAFDTHYGYLEKYKQNALVIPLRDINNKLWSLQYIFDEKIKFKDGNETNKLFLSGGKKKSCFHLIGTIDDNSTIYVAEGYATASSVYMATSDPTIVSFDAGNMDSVVSEIRIKYPNNKIIIAADNDK